MTTGVVCTPPILQFTLNNGQPAAGGSILTQVGGVNTATFADSALITPLPNPIPLNSRGEVSDTSGASKQLFLTPNTVYTFTLFDGPNGTGNEIWQATYVNGVQVSASAIGAVLYPESAAETTAGVTPTNLVYPYGDLRRYGAKIDGSTDDTNAIVNAIKIAQTAGSQGYVLHPGGTCAHASQILAGNGFSVTGADRNTCIFKYTGPASSSAWRITNNGMGSPVVNTSGFGLVNFTGVTISTAVASSTAAGIEINACGYSFYNLTQMRITGTFKYGLIMDGTEVSTVERCIIDNAGPNNAANIWIVNGPDRTLGQAQGFSNAIWIQRNQLNVNGASSNNIADDGGSDHYHSYNNLNGAAVPVRICGVSGFEINSNEVENALGGGATGEANLDFLTLTLSGASAGGCDSGEVTNNFLGADMVAGSSTLNFAGSASFKHSAITATNNHFRNNSGRVADINVTNLASSRCEKNYAEPGSSSQHYTGVHNDVYGNDLAPPQAAPPWRPLTAYAVNAIVFNSPNFYICTTGGTSGNSGGPTGTGTGIADGSVVWNFTTIATVVGFTQALRIFGDLRYVNQFVGGISADSPNGLQIDEQQWQSFTIQIINNSGTLQIQIFDSGVAGGTCAYANKVQSASATAVNLPTVSAGAGFGSAPGGIVSGSTSVLVLNVASAQVSAKSNQVAFIEQYNGNVAIYSVYCGNASRNINGVTLLRPEIRLVNAQSGAAVNFDTTLLPAGKAINIKFSGYLS